MSSLSKHAHKHHYEHQIWIENFVNSNSFCHSSSFFIIIILILFDYHHHCRLSHNTHTDIHTYSRCRDDLCWCHLVMIPFSQAISLSVHEHEHEMLFGLNKWHSMVSLHFALSDGIISSSNYFVYCCHSLSLYIYIFHSRDSSLFLFEEVVNVG